jgi:hypothetical protein
MNNNQDNNELFKPDILSGLILAHQKFCRRNPRTRSLIQMTPQRFIEYKIRLNENIVPLDQNQPEFNVVVENIEANLFQNYPLLINTNIQPQSINHLNPSNVPINNSDHENIVNGDIDLNEVNDVVLSLPSVNQPRQ